MKTVWKYRIYPQDSTIEFPRGAKILSVQTQHGVPCLWAEVESGNDTVNRRVSVCGTGHGFNFRPHNDYEYAGTFQLDDGELVFHVYIEKEQA